MQSLDMIKLKPEFAILVMEDEDSPQLQYRSCLKRLGIPDAQINLFRTKLETIQFVGKVACLIADIQVYAGSSDDPPSADKRHGLDAIRKLVGSKRLDPGQIIVITRFIENQEVKQVVTELRIPYGNVLRGPVADEDFDEALTNVLKRFNCII